jgi:hypothetical protein
MAAKENKGDTGLLANGLKPVASQNQRIKGRGEKKSFAIFQKRANK